MKANSASRSLVITLVKIIVVGITLCVLMIAVALPAVSQTSKGMAARAAQTPNPELVRAQGEWHQALLRLPHPKPGCYRATYPRVEWISTTCNPAPKYP